MQKIKFVVFRDNKKFAFVLTLAHAQKFLGNTRETLCRWNANLVDVYFQNDGDKKWNYGFAF